ncbi:AimR family lysis-lysogeny pheromone receptor [Shouchella lehensis]|uniref:SPBc2 prophage-derived uncharacterized protein n=1 Tax=Shouchella lehensis G1 TaxID=1246626 RepID=A0A060M073_9BACI|nr:AimR family lysis-lysogeny pheromone receptor [Shouchella lehensis]AIC95420.1 SPBc2 prophage-derived uncharacterized protein [Shouchella lehensis G1]
MNFREKMVSLMNEKELVPSQVAESLGWQRSIMSKFLSGTTLDFYNALRLAKYLDGINYLEIMDDYCLSMDKKSGILCAFEYASNFMRHELTDKLVLLHEDKKGEVGEYCTIYKFNRERRDYSFNDAIEFLKYHYGKTNSLEINTKILLIEAGMYFDEMKFQTVLSLLKPLHSKLVDVNNRFIKESFNVRFAIFAANAELKAAGNTEKSIEYCHFLMDSVVTPDNLVASAHHTMGHAKIFESRVESVYLLQKAANLYRVAGSEANADGVLFNDIPLANSIHGHEIDLNEISGEELAHQLIIRGRNDEALALLNDLQDTPYTLLYKGMASKNFPLILQAHGIMMKEGDSFFIKLFERELFDLYNHKGDEKYEKI